MPENCCNAPNYYHLPDCENYHPRSKSLLDWYRCSKKKRRGSDERIDMYVKARTIREAQIAFSQSLGVKMENLPQIFKEGHREFGRNPDTFRDALTVFQQFSEMRFYTVNCGIPRECFQDEETVEVYFRNPFRK